MAVAFLVPWVLECCDRRLPRYKVSGLFRPRPSQFCDFWSDVPVGFLFLWALDCCGSRLLRYVVSRFFGASLSEFCDVGIVGESCRLDSRASSRLT